MKKLAAFIDSSLFPELAAPAFLIAIFVLLISFHFAANFITRRRYGRKKPGGGLQKMPPEAGGSWPLIGHLHLLDGPLPPHLVLGQMADKYGPLFTIRLGLRKAVVANNWEVAKECLTTNDRAFATRPKTVGLDRLSYDYAVVGFSPYGPYWRHIRKLSTIELLSNQRVELLRQVRESEVLASLRDICKEYHRKSTASTGATSLLVDMKRWFGDITMNTMYRIIVGKRINDSSGDYENEKKALKNWSELLGRFLVSDGLPFLRWLDLGGYEKAMKSVAKEIDQILQDWLDEHKARRHLDGEADRVNKDQDFMGVMLSILGADDAEIHSYDCDTINKATCLTMLIAGTDTTTVTMTWALSLLINNKKILEEAQKELDTQIGNKRRVTESDLKNLPYLQAIIKETLRLYPPVPLSLPHAADEDCSVSGYSISKGTRLLLNLHKIQRDPCVWPDPSEFQPERFLTTNKDCDVRGKNFELIPFGSGRRMCPGISLAIQTIGLVLASFLHAFDVKMEEGMALEMEEVIGLTNLMGSPLEVLVTPRDPVLVYQ